MVAMHWHWGAAGPPAQAHASARDRLDYRPNPYEPNSEETLIQAFKVFDPDDTGMVCMTGQLCVVSCQRLALIEHLPHPERACSH